MSELVIPSYVLKADRAEKHLVDLKEEVQRWADTRPYRVVTAPEGKRKAVHRLKFTGVPPTSISMIASDLIYNIRSGLDHLMAALVPAAKRSSVYFPIYFDGVWNPAVPGENAERTKERGRWKSDTNKMRPEAVAILKGLQPDEDARNDFDTKINAFLFVNVVSNKDRHSKLPLLFTGLKDEEVYWRTPDAEVHSGRGAKVVGPNPVTENGAELTLPEGAMDVNILGTPLVAVRITDPKADVEIVTACERAVRGFRSEAIDPLIPYLWVTPPETKKGTKPGGA